jgi:hypothetical protein
MIAATPTVLRMQQLFLMDVFPFQAKLLTVAAMFAVLRIDLLLVLPTKATFACGENVNDLLSSHNLLSHDGILCKVAVSFVG